MMSREDAIKWFHDELQERCLPEDKQNAYEEALYALRGVTVEGKVILDSSTHNPILERRLYVDALKLGDALLELGPMDKDMDVIVTIRKK